MAYVLRVTLAKRCLGVISAVGRSNKEIDITAQ